MKISWIIHSISVEIKSESYSNGWWSHQGSYYTQDSYIYRTGQIQICWDTELLTHTLKTSQSGQRKYNFFLFFVGPFRSSKCMRSMYAVKDEYARCKRRKICKPIEPKQKNLNSKKSQPGVRSPSSYWMKTSFTNLMKTFQVNTQEHDDTNQKANRFLNPDFYEMFFQDWWSLDYEMGIKYQHIFARNNSSSLVRMPILTYCATEIKQSSYDIKQQCFALPFASQFSDK